MTAPALRDAEVALEGRERDALARRILRAWVADSPSGSAHTRAAKLGDLDAFGEFAGAKGSTRQARRLDAVALLVFGGFATAHERVRAWLAWMAARGADRRPRFASATRARRLAHLRSLVRTAQTFGLPWGLQVKGPKIRKARDASGPDAWRVYAELERIARAAASEETSEFQRHTLARDAAILQLLFVLGLRRGAVADLRLADYRDGKVWIELKGSDEPVARPVPVPTQRALEQWIAIRGRWDGPLFTGVRTGERRQGLTTTQIYRMARRRICNPHGLRHSGATKLAREGHTVFQIQAHLAHESPMTAQHYVDKADDQPGQTAAYLAQGLAALYDPDHGKSD